MSHERQKRVGITKESILNINERVTKCKLDDNYSPKNCRIFGSLVIDNKITTETEIILDTGASFSVISESFVKLMAPKAEISPSKRLGVVDASGQDLGIIGDVILTLRIKSVDEILELENIRFTVLKRLTANIIMGCEVLAGLKFEMSAHFANLCEKSIPRVMNIEGLNSPVVVSAPVIRGINIDYDVGSRCVLKLGFSKLVKLKPNTVYHLAYLDDFTSSCVKSPLPGGRYTTCTFAPTDDFGKLNPKVDLVSFDSPCSEVPVTVHVLIIGTSDTSGHSINLLDVKNLHISKELLEKMTQNSLLDKNQLQKLIKRNKPVFSLDKMDLGCYKRPIEIKLRDPTIEPKYAKPITYPYKARAYLDHHLQMMLDHDLIQISKGSPFNSPCHLIPKKSGEKRMITNFMYVNTLIEQNRWPIPSVRNVLEHLAGSKFFSVMDLKKGFWQIKITENSRSLTAFSCRGRLYEYKRLPQGMSISPGAFQSVMMEIFGKYVFKGIIVFVDDVLVYSKTKNEHFNLLKIVFNRLKLSGMKLSPEKSVFGVTEVDYLGYSINSNGYKPLKGKVDTILKLEPPKNKTELKSFVGMLTFYGTSLPLLQYTLDPLHKISGSNSKFVWGKEQQLAFEKAKEILTNCAHLAFPSENSKLILTTDASDKAYGGCLSEINERGSEVPIRYFSGSFKGPELNYIIREKELFAFFIGVKYCEELLICRPFTWRSDNKSISTLADSTLKVKSTGSTNYRLLRWLDYLNRFDFNTELYKGTDNAMCLADSISRLTPAHDDSALNVLSLPFWAKHGIALVDFVKAQESDIDLMKRAGDWSKYAKSKSCQFKIIEGTHCIKYKSTDWLPMCPKILVQNVMDYYHLPSHSAVQKMFREIRGKMFVPKLMHAIIEYRNKCVQCCAIRTQKKPQAEKIKTSTAIHPWLWGACDLIGPLPKSLDGNVYILTYVDLFSRWIEIRALPDKTAPSVLRALDSIFSVRGPCLNLTGDNGREFINKLVQNYLKDLGIHWNLICPYRPQSNGLCERKNQQIKQALQFRKDVEFLWDRELPSIQLDINLQKQSDGLSAFQKLHGFLLYRPAYLAAQFEEKTHEKYLATEDEWAKSMIVRMTKAIGNQFCREESAKMSHLDGKSTNTYKPMIGDTVLVHFPEGNESKLIPNWKGMYRIKEKLDKNTYIVSLIGNERKKYIVHRLRIRSLQEHQNSGSEPGGNETPAIKANATSNSHENEAEIQSRTFQKNEKNENSQYASQNRNKLRRSAATAALAKMKTMR